jgi:hypothetical protein
MPKTTANTSAADQVPHLRVTASATQAVPCAGQWWAGITELPAAQFSAAQLVELKADKRLQVEEITRPLATDPQPAEGAAG